MLAKSEDTQELTFTSSPTKALFALFRNERTRVLLAFLFFCIKHSPTWVIPLLTANTIDLISSRAATSKLLINVGILFVVTAQNWPINLLYVNFQSKAIRDVEKKLRQSLVEKMQRLTMGFYNRTNAGVIQTKIVRDVENIEQMVRSLSDSGFTAINGIVGAILVTAIKVPAFLPFFLVLAPLIAVFIVKLRFQLRKKNDDFRSEIEAMSARVNVMTTLIPITRAQGLEESAIETMSESFSSVKRVGFALDIFSAKFSALAWVSFQLANVSCLAVASYCALRGKFGVTIGDVVLLTSFFSQLIASIIMLSSLMPQISKGFASLRSLGEVLESKSVETNIGKPKINEVHGTVIVDRVSFTYANSPRPAIANLSIEAKSGEMVALVGPSGSGKSTLVNLIIGFLRPDEGDIYIDGNCLRDYDLRSYRQFISVVPQESVLFEGTVEENISYGLKDARNEDVESALRSASAYDFVMNLPEGIHTKIGERGARLSGGQKQRLAIARALIRNPKILILDEATSALDSESERSIQQALETLMENRTIFVVAHRLSTVRKADTIVVLDEGRMVESGRHEELVRAGGMYKRLYDAQTFYDDSAV